MALSAITPLSQTPCQLSSLASLSPLHFLSPISPLSHIPLSLFSRSLHPRCENHRGLCQLVNTTLKKAGHTEQPEKKKKKEPLHVRTTGKN